MALSISEIRRQREEASGREDREIIQEWKWYALTFKTSFTACLRLKKVAPDIKVEWENEKGKQQETIYAKILYSEPIYNEFLTWIGQPHTVIVHQPTSKKGKPKVEFEAVWPRMFEGVAERDTGSTLLIDKFVEFIVNIYPKMYNPETKMYSEGYNPDREKYRHIKTESQLAQLKVFAEIIIGRRIMEAKHKNNDFADPEVGASIAYNYGMNYKRDEIARLINGIIEAAAGVITPPEENRKLAEDIAHILSERLGSIINGLDTDEDKKLIMQDGASGLIEDTVLEKIEKANAEGRKKLGQYLIDGLFELWEQIDDRAKPSNADIETILAMRLGSGDRFKFIKSAVEAKTEEVKSDRVGGLIELGKMLIEAKERLPYGRFQERIEAETGLSRSTIYNAMNVAKKFGDNPQMIEGLPLSTIYKLAAPSTPDQAIERVTEQTQQSKAFTFDAIRKALEKARKEILGNE